MCVCPGRGAGGEYSLGVEDQREVVVCFDSCSLVDR